jgi:hypothetical protein
MTRCAQALGAGMAAENLIEQLQSDVPIEGGAAC